MEPEPADSHRNEVDREAARKQADVVAHDFWVEQSDPGCRGKQKQTVGDQVARCAGRGLRPGTASDEPIEYVGAGGKQKSDTDDATLAGQRKPPDHGQHEEAQPGDHVRHPQALPVHERSLAR
jgi:hypothetical protein